MSKEDGKWLDSSLHPKPLRSWCILVMQVPYPRSKPTNNRSPFLDLNLI